MTRTKEEWESFKDNSIWCLCGKLMTGRHMASCSKVKKEDAKHGIGVRS